MPTDRIGPYRAPTPNVKCVCGQKRYVAGKKIRCGCGRWLRKRNGRKAA